MSFLPDTLTTGQFHLTVALALEATGCNKDSPEVL